MKLIHHKNLDQKKWFSSSILYQMANIGSEVFRTLSWRDKGNKAYSDLAFERALELTDLTMDDPKNIHRLREITRAREMLVDWHSQQKINKSDDNFWQNYFSQFTYAARLEEGKI